MVQESHNFNNNAYRRFIETLKGKLKGCSTPIGFITIADLRMMNETQDSMDPNGILSPEEPGISPKAYRELRQWELDS